MKKINKTGLVLVIIYLLFALGTYLYSISCSGFFCDLAIYNVFLPWIFIDSIGKILFDIPMSAAYSAVTLINIVSLYCIGVGLGRFLGWLSKDVDVSTLSDN